MFWLTLYRTDGIVRRYIGFLLGVLFLSLDDVEQLMFLPVVARMWRDKDLTNAQRTRMFVLITSSVDVTSLVE